MACVSVHTVEKASCSDRRMCMTCSVTAQWLSRTAKFREYCQVIGNWLLSAKVKFINLE